MRGGKHSGKRKPPLQRPAGRKEQGFGEQQEYHVARGGQGGEGARPGWRGGGGGSQATEGFVGLGTVRRRVLL